MPLAFEQMKRDQEQIDRLKQESQAISSEIREALDRLEQ
jgi:uncharacterized protein (UPF0335 family)